MLHQAMQVVVIVMLASQRQLAQVLNLHVRHAPQAVARTASQVRRVLRAISASTLLLAWQAAPTAMQVSRPVLVRSSRVRHALQAVVRTASQVRRVLRVPMVITRVAAVL